MNHNKIAMLFGGLLLAVSINTAMAAQPGSVQALKAPTAQGPLSTKERSGMTKQFVKRWGAYVQKIYGIDVGTWSSRMASQFATADSDNFRDALKRDTFEGALNALGGTGFRVSDERAITLLAKEQLADTRGTPTKVFGALTNDLVYTPVAPCRIVDTRVAGGQILASATRNFVGFGVSSFASQGGSATNCGVNPLAATAIAVNVTAVGPTAQSFTTVYPYNTTRPLAASINYNAGFNVNNALIVQTPNPIAAFDFTIYSGADAHYVVDIVGFFAPPLATALQCVDTLGTDLAVAAGAQGNVSAPVCATGYTQTATNCRSNSWLMPFVFNSGGTCSAQNNSGVSATLTAARTCCRVPGR